MHLQENTLFDLGIKVTQNVAHYPLHYVTYSGTKFEVATRRYINKKRDGRMHSSTDEQQTNFGTK